MGIDVYDVDDAGFHDQLRQFVLNCHRTPSPWYLVVHAKDCSYVRKWPHPTSGQYIKVCADSIGELEGWAADKTSGGRVSFCTRCKPQDVLTETECTASSLLGYAKNIHAVSGAVCAYCGFGQGSSEALGHTDFDLWRQLTLEHVIPARRLELLNDNICRAIDTLLGTQNDWPKKRAHKQAEYKKIRVRNAIYTACEVSCCHFCNSLTSRDEGRETDFTTFEELFEASELKALLTHDGDEQAKLEQYLKKIRSVVMRVFKKRQDLVRGKLVNLAKKYNEYAVVELRNKRRVEPPRSSYDGLQKELWDNWPAAEIARSAIVSDQSCNR